MGISTLLTFLLIPLPQAPSTLPTAPPRAEKAAKPATHDLAKDTGLVLVPSDAELLRGLALGDGGIANGGIANGGIASGPASVAVEAAATGERTSRRSVRAALGDGELGIGTTPGGVRVHCLDEGVKLTFPSGRELLFAPDGHLHLRDGSHAGPFVAGVDLWLTDGSRVLIDRSGSKRLPVESVDVLAGEDSVRLWRRGTAVRERARQASWAQPVFCLGDGGALYEARATGPLVALSLVLADEKSAMPKQRLALRTERLVASMEDLLASRMRRNEEKAAAEIDFLLQQKAEVFRVDRGAPARVGSDPLLWLLPGGYDLAIEHENGLVMARVARHQEKPFVEWRLGYVDSICCLDETPESGSDLRSMPSAELGLQITILRNDVARVTSVIDALKAAR